MGKLKSLVKNIAGMFKSLIKELPVTIISIFLLTIIFAATIDTDFESGKVVGSILTFLAISSCISLFIEVVLGYKKSKLKTVGAFAINILVTSFYTFLFNTDLDYIFGIDIDILLERFGCILVGILGSLALAAIYKMYKNTGTKFHEYVLNVFSGTLKVGIFDIIIHIGIAVIFFLTESLIFEDLDYMIYSRCFILVQGLFVIPAELRVLLGNNKKELESFFRVLISYILLPLYIIINFILYVYIVKILIKNEIPVGFIYPVVAAIFSFGYLIYNFIKNYDDKKFIKVSLKALPYGLIPLIILQIYAAALRFSGFGITPLRYVSYMFIIFEIVAICLMAVKKGELSEKSVITFIALLLVSTCTPLNVIDVSNYNQKLRLYSVLNINTADMTEEQIDKFESAYYYLKAASNGDKYITDEVKAKMDEISENGKSVKTKDKDTKGYFSYRLEDETDPVDIKEYSYMESYTFRANFSKEDYDYTDCYEYEDCAYIDYDIDSDDKYGAKIINKISSIMREANIDDMNFDIRFYMDQNGSMLKLDDADIYVSTLNVYYYKDSGEITSVYLKGYVFTK